MPIRLQPIAVALLALAFASGNAQAQSAAKRGDARVVPVLNKDSGKLEAVLLLRWPSLLASERGSFIAAEVLHLAGSLHG